MGDGGLCVRTAVIQGYFWDDEGDVGVLLFQTYLNAEIFALFLLSHCKRFWLGSFLPCFPLTPSDHLPPGQHVAAPACCAASCTAAVL